MVPSPPCIPETYQFTPRLVVPLITAVKDRDSPPRTLIAAGEIETPSGPDGLPAMEPVPLVDAGARDPDELAEVLRPICDPLHAVRDNAHSNRKTFRFISASCPPENHNEWVLARQPGLLGGFRRQEESDDRAPNGTTDQRFKSGATLTWALACSWLPLGQSKRASWAMESLPLRPINDPPELRGPEGNLP